MQVVEIEKLKAGEVPALFPNLGIEVFANGCKCKLLTVSLSGNHKAEVLDGYKSGYKVGTIIPITSFLIEPVNERTGNQA